MLEDSTKLQLFYYLFRQEESPLREKELSQISFLYEQEENFEELLKTEDISEYSLMEIMMREKREAKELQKFKTLQNTVFFDMKLPRALEDRYLWLNHALHFSNKAQIVDLSPDNGMAIKCQRKTESFEFLNLEEHYRQKVYPQKYLFEDELSYFYRLPYLEVCVIYQYLGRCFSHERQISVILAHLTAQYNYVLSIKHKTYSPRVFFFLCKSQVIYDYLAYRLETFESEFSEFWEYY